MGSSRAEAVVFAVALALALTAVVIVDGGLLVSVLVGAVVAGVVGGIGTLAFGGRSKHH